MAFSTDIERKFVLRKELYYLFTPTPRIVTKESIRNEEREHIGAKYLPELDKIILDYYAPQRASNSTALFKDELSEYISFLEKRNSSLSLRLAELERKFKAIEPYIPTIAMIISDFTAVETRIEEKKKYLRKKYSIKEAGEIKLWAGAEERSDIADTTLDEMLGNIEEDE